MKVTIVSTKGIKVSKLESTSQTWGELQTELATASIPYDGMKAIIGQTQVTLESSKAVLPDFDFTLFLTPVKVKSGTDAKNMSRPELYKAIQDFREDNPTQKDLFNKYSSLSTIVLQELVNKHILISKENVIVKDIEEVSTEEILTSDSLNLIKQQLANIEGKINATAQKTVSTPQLNEDEIIKAYLLKLQEEETTRLMQEFTEIEKNLK